MSGDAWFAGRNVVVTGCASGIGRATAALLTAGGARVHGIDLHEPDLPLAGFVAADLGDRAAIDGAVLELPAAVDSLFNCAGLPPTRPPAEVMGVNFLGVRYLSERLAERLAPGGAIVSTSSTGGLGWRGNLPAVLSLLDTGTAEAEGRWLAEHLAGVNAYGFSKEALTVWTLRRSATLIAERGIRLNCTSPGAVETAMLDEIGRHVPAAAIDAVTRPIGRRSSAEEQARVLLFLNRPEAGYINGVDLPVDGGFTATRSFAA